MPDGDVGEICVRGPLVMQGYWNKPDETAQAPRHGWPYTGDMARRDADGDRYTVDRSKDMIISVGFNAYPREVGDALSREAVRALVLLRCCGPALWPARMSSWRWCATPKAIDFFDVLPMAGLGKLDKKAIRVSFWQDQGRAVH